jgi:hypothetical protein
MRRIQVKLNRFNSNKGTKTTRYRWEIIVDERRMSLLFVERYGWTGNKAYAWIVNRTDWVHKLAARLARFDCTREDDLVVSFDKEFTDDMLAAWTSAEQLDKQKWDAAIWRFKNSPSGNDFGWWGENQAWAQICSLNDAAHQYNFLSSYAIPAIAKPFSEPIAPEPKSASWGVW